MLYEADPLGLAACGCPTNEYEPELRTILPRLATCASNEAAQRVIFEEFASWFAPCDVGRLEDYRDLSVRIWALWERNKPPP